MTALSLVVPSSRRPPQICRSVLLRADRVRGALNEGLKLRDVLLLQPAREVGHTLVDERTIENEVLQVGDGLLGHVAKVPDNAAIVDAGYAMARSAGGDIDSGTLGNVLRIVCHARKQIVSLIFDKFRQRRLAIESEGINHTRGLQLGGAKCKPKYAAPTHRDRDILLTLDQIGRGRRDYTGPDR